MAEVNTETLGARNKAILFYVWQWFPPKALYTYIETSKRKVVQLAWTINLVLVFHFPIKPIFNCFKYKWWSSCQLKSCWWSIKNRPFIIYKSWVTLMNIVIFTKPGFLANGLRIFGSASFSCSMEDRTETKLLSEYWIACLRATRFYNTFRDFTSCFWEIQI